MYGNRIRESRQKIGLTQVLLAEALETTQGTIGKYEREELQPNIDVIVKLCKILNVSSDYLLGITDNNTPTV